MDVNEELRTNARSLAARAPLVQALLAIAGLLCGAAALSPSGEPGFQVIGAVVGAGIGFFLGSVATSFLRVIAYRALKDVDPEQQI